MSRSRGFVVRAAAISLVLLAMSPLTYPFATLDVAALAVQGGAHDSGSLKTKPLNDVPHVARPGLTAPPAFDLVAHRSSIPPTLTDRQQSEQRVLRI